MSTQLVYAGIGARSTPPDVLVRMERLAVELRERGAWLRSGHASGADSAFECGARERACLYLPWAGYNGPVLEAEHVMRAPLSDALRISARFHPAWDQLSRGARALHGRNAHILLGCRLRAVVDVIVCWSPNGAITGGTGQALRMAHFYDIPFVNLAVSPDVTADRLMTFERAMS